MAQGWPFSIQRWTRLWPAMPWGGSDRYQLQWSGQVQLMKVKVNQLSYSQLVLLIKGARSVSTISTKIIDTKPMGLVLWDIFGGCLATNCCNRGHGACSIASTALGEPNFTSTALGRNGNRGVRTAKSVLLTKNMAGPRDCMLTDTQLSRSSFQNPWNILKLE